MRPSIHASFTSSPCSDNRRAAAMTTSISRNISSGNAVQINGPVAEKVCNFHFQNLIVSCPCSSATKLATSLRTPVTSSARKLELSTPSSVKQIPSPVQAVEQPVTALLDGSSNNSQVRKENLSFTSRLSRMRHPVRAMFRPDLPISFIARRIVKRLELETHRNDVTGKDVSMVHPGIPYTDEYVELPCHPGKGARRVINRFYVVKDCCFDLVFGADSTGPHP